MSLKVDQKNDDEKIVLSFAFEGERKTLNGKTKFDLVDVVFKGAKSEISISLDDYVKKENEENSYYPFTVRKPEKKYLVQTYTEKKVALLNVTMEQMKNLTLKAATFTTYENWSFMTKHLDGTIKPEIRVRREDHFISLNVPEILEANKKYSLIVKSEIDENKQFNFNAKLVKLEDVKNENIKIEKTKNISENFLNKKETNIFYISSFNKNAPKLNESEQEFLNRLVSFELDSILDEGEGEKKCKSLGQEIFDKYKNEKDGDSNAGKKAVQKICDAIPFSCKDGSLRKQYIERAWNGIGDNKWRWMS
jgi:hypothetical protein